MTGPGFETSKREYKDKALSTRLSTAQGWRHNTTINPLNHSMGTPTGMKGLGPDTNH